MRIRRLVTLGFILLAISFCLLAYSSNQATSRMKVFFDLGNCTLTARQRVDLRVYEEKRDGTKGELLWDGTLEKDASRSFASSTDRLRYDYRLDAKDQYHGDVGCSCKSNDVSVP